MIQKYEWDDKYLLGIDEIDEQHKKLIAIANELYTILTGSEENYAKEMEKTLKNIVDYTVYHFSHEENFMMKYGYAGSEIHKTAHAGFVQEVNFQIKKLSASDRQSGEKFYSFIGNWILTHIAKADKVWAGFVKAKL